MPNGFGVGRVVVLRLEIFRAVFPPQRFLAHVGDALFQFEVGALKMLQLAGKIENLRNDFKADLEVQLGKAGLG